MIELRKEAFEWTFPIQDVTNKGLPLTHALWDLEQVEICMEMQEFGFEQLGELRDPSNY